MTDYGHELRFGSFLTPQAREPVRVVELAVLSEQIGLDLVTFQDHPYQPAFLDTWTLLSFVAARTGTITLSANVLNLPLRIPAVVARSAASLDLLSDGRVELGLGAGAFWDGVEAMGGPRRAPGPSVKALEEAIDVIRELWDTQARGLVRVEGEHYRVVGAKRGPAAAHDMEIWLGAYKPRILALTGRRADGWLPSMSYVTSEELAAGNTIIDEAARSAGRSPRDIRRLLNVNGTFAAVAAGRLHGPARQWSEELSELALDQGFSTFILATDDPDELRRFAGEVAPGVRELVTADRSGGGTPGASVTPTGDESAARLAPAALGSPSSRGSVTATPPPRTRRSSAEMWDETTRPTGPAPDHSREFSGDEMANSQLLIDVHNGLRAELDQIHDLIEQVAAGTIAVTAARSHINTMTMRQNKWTLGTYCESYCRLVTTHHSLEDRALFPRLRRADSRLVPVIDRLEAEHRTIHEVLEGVDRALVAFVGVPDGIAELRAAVDLLSDTLLSHLAYEERELIEPLALHTQGMFEV